MRVYDRTTIASPEGSDTNDIIQALLNATPAAFNQVKGHAEDMINVTGNPIKDAIAAGKFIQENVSYKADGYQFQNIKLPARLLRDAVGDCKSFSLLACSILNDLGYTCGFRFASYKKNKIPTHVYNWVIDNNGKKFIFDACLPSLKESKRHTFIQDMQVNYLSEPFLGAATFNEADFIAKARAAGKSEAEIAAAVKMLRERFGAVTTAIQTSKPKGGGVKKIALAPVRNAFIALVRLNVRGLASKLRKTLNKKASDVKSFWQKLGGNYSKLEEAIRAGEKKKPLLGAKKSGKITGANQVAYYKEYLSEPYIGELTLAAVGTFLTAASPALVAASALFKKNFIPDDGEKVADADMPPLDPTGEGFEASDPEEGSGLNLTGENPSPLLIGGVLVAAAAAYLLTRKKK